MFLKLIVLSVLWLEIHCGIENDIYELEFWSRSPQYESKRRSPLNVKPNRRHELKSSDQNNGEMELVHRVKKLREGFKPENTKSTRYKLVLNALRSSTKHDGSGNKKSEENQSSDDSSSEEDKVNQLSPYSLKKTMTDLSCELGKENNISVEVLGRTFEYNDIVLLKISEKTSAVSKYFRANDKNKYIDDTPVKKIIFIVHGLSIKGIRVVECLFKIKQFRKLLNFYLEHLDKFDIFLMPLANPDGFVQSFSDPYWNKNMSPQNQCNGVALDRNFDVSWSSQSIEACSQNYPGPAAFSEPETKAIREVFHNYGHKIIAYINVHAGAYITKTFKGEAVLYPKGYTEAQTDDDKYMDMKGEIDEALRNASFQRMTVTTDTLYHWYGKVTGTSVDYASTVFGIPYAMEFVMQPYSHAKFNHAALTAVWKRVIDAVFNFIHKRGDPSESRIR